MQPSSQYSKVSSESFGNEKVSKLTVQQLLDLHQITAEDLTAVHQYGKLITPHFPHFVDRFYTWMEEMPEFLHFFQDQDKLRRVQRSQGSFWDSFFEAQVDEDYILQRHRLGAVHAHIGLSLSAYFSALSVSQDLLLYQLYPGGMSEEKYHQALRACNKLIQLDASLIVEAYAKLTNQRLSEQAEAMMEMSTPVTSLWDHILMLPVVGIIDSRRASNMMSAVLHKIAETRAKVFIIDIGGVSIVDTAVANHLIKITQAARLMGCTCLLSGVSPAIAQTTIELGIDIENVLTRATMRDALEEAFRLINVTVS